MQITLLRSTDKPLELITNAASICYGKESSSNPSKLLSHLHQLGHHSVFEHIYYTWKIEGISRACLGQLTRHRHASFTVRSQRYSNEENQEFVVPEEISEDDLNFLIWSEAIAKIKETYKQLIKRGILREDARFILPQATQTDLYFSCNLRELMHIANLRISKQAQWEIRELAKSLVGSVLDIYPELSLLFEGDDNENN